ncbi:MAG: hypothetical protein A2898_00685 [Candidatus Kerfeldbacteria bacterium RIFCSPLOWO2_01_FULL_48_11]|uniref:Uncharacterized protein n=1 Tax=Candidatus Kerfeldbacteria bacterium RIFCSPLOWO2_01_FULL_48_11 TaxID=1798543 RepID=A0A1G2B1F7_9BACT|nr:MAG: hypothetical protein UY34_C0019G0070 [Parcubacteria group bacterium GW2011_GWA2_48_9]KKW16022.1 MAG: hypothetical protein UY52_C0011G0010 [Parcubacteria group bacterium GW2011_GWC2_49_9]OGY83023.1 MAG: hypothetical protein A2898_00685 [Candidatus Kerfeldbacteria bacterium RIFCSPLOWO2_01_FULL_48_11]
MSKKPISTLLAIAVLLVATGMYFAVSPVLATNNPAVTTQTTTAIIPMQAMKNVGTPASTTCNGELCCLVIKKVTESTVDSAMTTTTCYANTANAMTNGPNYVATTMNTEKMFTSNDATYGTNTAENPWMRSMTSVAGLDAGNGCCPMPYSGQNATVNSGQVSTSTCCPWAVVEYTAYPNPFITGSYVT